MLFDRSETIRALGAAFLKTWAELSSDHFGATDSPVAPEISRKELLSLLLQLDKTELKNLLFLLGQFFIEVLSPIGPASDKSTKEKILPNDPCRALPEKVFEEVMDCLYADKNGQVYLSKMFTEIQSKNATQKLKKEDKIKAIKDKLFDGSTKRILFLFSLFKQFLPTNDNCLVQLLGMENKQISSWGGVEADRSKMAMRFISEVLMLAVAEIDLEKNKEDQKSSCSIADYRDGIAQYYKILKDFDDKKPIEVDQLNQFIEDETATICLPSLAILTPQAFKLLKEEVRQRMVTVLEFEDGTELQEEDVRRIGQLLGEGLEGLDLSNVLPLKFEDFKKFVELFKNSANRIKLTFLNLTEFLKFENNAVFSPYKDSLLAQLGRLKNLESLYLSDCELSDKNIENLELGFRKGNSSLEEILLNQNVISDVGLSDLVALVERLPRLTWLDLEENEYFNDNGKFCFSKNLSKLLAAVLKNQKLVHLDISLPRVAEPAETSKNEVEENVAVQEDDWIYSDETVDEISGFLADPRCPLETFRMKFDDGETSLQACKFASKAIAALRNNSKIKGLDFTGLTLSKVEAEALLDLLRARRNITEFIFTKGSLNPELYDAIQAQLNENKTPAKPVQTENNTSQKTLKKSSPRKPAKPSKNDIFEVVKKAIINDEDDEFFYPAFHETIIGYEFSVQQEILLTMFEGCVDLGLNDKELPGFASCDPNFLFDIAVFYAFFSGSERLDKKIKQEFLKLLWDAQEENEGVCLALLLIYHIDPASFNQKKIAHIKIDESWLQELVNNCLELEEEASDVWRRLVLATAYRYGYGIAEDREKSLYCCDYSDGHEFEFNSVAHFLKSFFHNKEEGLHRASDLWLPIASICLQQQSVYEKVKLAFKEKPRAPELSLDANKSASKEETLAFLLAQQTNIKNSLLDQLNELFNEPEFALLFGSIDADISVLEKAAFYQGQMENLLSDVRFNSLHKLIKKVKTAFVGIIEHIKARSCDSQDIKKMSAFEKDVDLLVRLHKKNLANAANLPKRSLPKKTVLKSSENLINQNNKEERKPLTPRVVKKTLPVKKVASKKPTVVIDTKEAEQWDRWLEGAVKKLGNESNNLSKALDFSKKPAWNKILSNLSDNDLQSLVSRQNNKVLSIVGFCAVFLWSFRATHFLSAVKYNLTRKNDFWTARNRLAHDWFIYASKNKEKLNKCGSVIVECFSKNLKNTEALKKDRIFFATQDKKYLIFQNVEEKFDQLFEDVKAEASLETIREFIKEQWGNLKELVSAAKLLEPNAFKECGLLHHGIIGCIVMLAEAFKKQDKLLKTVARDKENFNESQTFYTIGYDLRSEFRQLRNDAAHGVLNKNFVIDTVFLLRIAEKVDKENLVCAATIAVGVKINSRNEVSGIPDNKPAYNPGFFVPASGSVSNMNTTRQFGTEYTDLINNISQPVSTQKMDDRLPPEPQEPLINSVLSLAHNNPFG